MHTHARIITVTHTLTQIKYRHTHSQRGTHTIIHTARSAGTHTLTQLEAHQLPPIEAHTYTLSQRE